MSVLINDNGSLVRQDAAAIAQLAAVDTEGILGGTPGATTDGQTLVDQLAADDVQAQTDIGQIKTDLSDFEDDVDETLQEYHVTPSKNLYNAVNVVFGGTTSIFTNNGNGTYTINGTPSEFSSISQNGRTTNWGRSAIIKSGTYVLSGLPDGYGSDLYMLATVTKNGASYQLGQLNSGDGSLTITVTSDDYAADGMQIQLNIYAKANVTFDNVIVSPMICTPAEYDADPSFVQNWSALKDWVDNFKSAVAASSDFSDFKTKVSYL